MIDCLEVTSGEVGEFEGELLVYRGKTTSGEGFGGIEYYPKESGGLRAVLRKRFEV